MYGSVHVNYKNVNYVFTTVVHGSSIVPVFCSSLPVVIENSSICSVKMLTNCSQDGNFDKDKCIPLATYFTLKFRHFDTLED